MNRYSIDSILLKQKLDGYRRLFSKKEPFPTLSKTIYNLILELNYRNGRKK